VKGPYPGDPFVLPLPTSSYAEAMRAPLGPLRVACSTTNWATGAPVPAPLARAVAAVTRELEAMGHTVEEMRSPLDVASAYAANRLAFDSTLLLLEPFAALLGRPADHEHLEPVVLDAFRRVSRMSPSELTLASLSFNVARRSIAAQLDGYDVLVTPTLAVEHLELGTVDCSSFDTVAAFREASERTVFTFTAPFNVTGQPAISLPTAATAEGTPIGVQLVARMAGEDVLLALARALEERLPWHDRRPRIHAAAL
jgi:amidase